MILLVILFLLILVFDPSVALVILALAILIYGGYFLIATLTDVAISSGHPVVTGLIIALLIVGLIVLWFKKSSEAIERDTYTINGQRFYLKDAVELIKQGKTSMAMASIRHATGLAWDDVKALADQMLKENSVLLDSPQIRQRMRRDAISDTIERGKENMRQLEEDRVVRWIGQAIKEDCWYDGNLISGPKSDYWSDGSIKRDPWTGRTFPKGQYFLDSHGHNSTGVKIPLDAKRCPG